ncbi:hypothetical protein PoB_000556100 [Plakobranchus ocellatus]|uniref:Uncharacterized protein n=1 Tax=Plakobranchus ocellatus TaxID=259542 RepID=A0AAV3XVN2_9GAST|nr:hypothetical protein PoB_000556100 [Plakobranchus ocellatus]
MTTAPYPVALERHFFKTQAKEAEEEADERKRMVCQYPRVDEKPFSDDWDKWNGLVCTPVRIKDTEQSKAEQMQNDGTYMQEILV